jgi:hypothetical protein
MLIALACAALTILALVLVLGRRGPGRQWIFAGVLVLSAAAQLDWYGLNHRWPGPTRRPASRYWWPISSASRASPSAGSSRAGPAASRAGDVTVLR